MYRAGKKKKIKIPHCCGRKMTYKESIGRYICEKCGKEVLGTKTPVYWCDPVKNDQCRKTGCKYLDPRNPCYLTLNPAFAKLNEEGKPIIEQ